MSTDMLETFGCGLAWGCRNRPWSQAETIRTAELMLDQKLDADECRAVLNGFNRVIARHRQDVSGDRWMEPAVDDTFPVSPSDR